MLFGTPKNPKGPNGKWENVDISLSGTKLTFAIPTTNKYADHGQMEPVGSLNLYDETTFGYDEWREFIKGTQYCGLFTRIWQFDGLRFTTRMGGYGNLELSARIDRLPEFVSLFRPRRRECAIERYIYSSYQFKRLPNHNRVNYRLNKQGENVWSCYDNADKDVATYTCSLPISDEHLLTFDFRVRVYLHKTQVIKAAKALAYKIMETVTVELSEDAKHSKKEAEETYPWEKLHKTLPPYDFEYVSQKRGLDFINEASAANNHDIDIPYEVVKDQANKIEADHKSQLAAIRDRVLASHLRFEKLEAQDAQQKDR